MARQDGRGELTRHELVHPRLGGTGYPHWRREEVVAQYEDPARRHFVGESIRRSIRRWIRRRAQTGTLHRDPMNQGRKRRMNPLEIGLCFVTKRARPTANSDEVANMITHQTGRVFSRDNISRALNHYGSWGNMSRKGIEQCPRERDALRRAMWRLRPPPAGVRAPVASLLLGAASENSIAPTRAGAAGVPRNDWIDLDECAIYITTSNRCWGHAYVGERAIEVQRYEPGVRFTLLMGVGCRLYDLYFSVFENEAVDSDKWCEFLDEQVFPHCGTNRALMYDNLSSHLTAQAQATCVRAGHRQMPRPPYSPDLAPIEYVFGLIQSHLKKFQFKMNQRDFRHYLQLAINLAVTPASVQAIFDHCDY